MMKYLSFLGCFLLAGCALISEDHEKWRLDPDADGIKWPIDCDDDDEKITVFTWFRDRDEDGYGEDSTGVCQCSKPGIDYVLQGGDCNDEDAAIFPAAEEICDEIDNDCNNLIDDEDEGLLLDNANHYYFDGDGDGYGIDVNPLQSCSPPEGYTSQGGDCNDSAEDTDGDGILDGYPFNPGAAEECDEIDNNCNNLIDEGFEEGPFYIDNDGDGYGDNAIEPVEDCSGDENYVLVAGDCDDNANDDDGDGVLDGYPINPDAAEECDEIDNNCNDQVDEDVGNTYYYDGDNDSYGGTNTKIACSPPAQYRELGGDCDDSDSDTFPGAAELEDELSCMKDADRDGFGDDNPSVGVDAGTDCDDEADKAFPGAAEEESPTACMLDEDEDGYGSSAPNTNIEIGTDCDDNNASTFPGIAAAESSTACMLDADSDGYGDLYALPPVAIGTDCDDGDDTINIAATELWYDGIDQDCGFDNDDDADHDGYESDVNDSNNFFGDDCDDNSAATFPGSAPNELDIDACMLDSDDDDYGDDNPSAGVDAGTDCDDGDDTINPIATEIAADGIDQDCDNQDICYQDNDDDGYGSSQFIIGSMSCSNSGESTNMNDCDDEDDTINPIATEIAVDGIDQDCDGQDICYQDSDGDGYGSSQFIIGSMSCSNSGESTNMNDCDDGASTTFPGAAPMDSSIQCMKDEDGDDYGDDNPPTGVSAGMDCDDSDDTINPGVIDTPSDGIDNDCDGTP